MVAICGIFFKKMLPHGHQNCGHPRLWGLALKRLVDRRLNSMKEQWLIVVHKSAHVVFHTCGKTKPTGAARPTRSSPRASVRSEGRGRDVHGVRARERSP